MSLFLGIDGGGTGCRAVLADAQGGVLGRGDSGPANIAVQTETPLANIVAATRAALDQAGLRDPGGLTAVLGLAGAEITARAHELQTLLPFRKARIVTDAVTAATGALGGDDGIVAAMGTGSVLAVHTGGETRQFGGRGFVLGDEGSGAVLGRTLLTEALRAKDGFAPMTPLLQSVLDELGGVEGVVSFGFRARPAEFGTFAPRVVEGGDPAAQRIFAAAVAQVSEMIRVLQQGRNLPVVFLGGLGGHYAQRLAGLWDIRPARGTGLDGALLLALQET